MTSQYSVKSTRKPKGDGPQPAPGKKRPNYLRPDTRRGFRPGNPGRPTNTPISQALTSLPHEIDSTTNKAKIYTLCDRLYELAVGYPREREVLTKDGKVVTLHEDVPPDVNAIREIVDRVQGKPKQNIDIKQETKMLFDVTKLSDDELMVMEQLLMKGSIPEMPKLIEGEVIDEWDQR
jgi:hypothetical protein